MKRIFVFIMVFFIVHFKGNAQNAHFHDSLYYNFWVGEWHQVVNGKVMEHPRFIVKKGLYPSFLEELWLMEGYKAKAWRGWDKSSDSWIFVWVSELGHYQIWDEKKVDGNWYMFKTFEINDKEVLSRQAFILQDDGTVLRTSEHSRDNGESWVLRFQEVYKKRVGKDGRDGKF